ncbi:hypothetical protein [Desulfotruncus alcoholivorax]|uniref:hypothetical protein n=1 Tax=Desulfotruncus alcoholivorax TaxID=265477 RepID=UPI00042A51D3|nr:hypothetical protein [Desulfotruncus alcoholivorax]
MTDLPIELYKPAVTILFGLLCGSAGIIAYFLRDIRQAVKEKHKEQDEKINKLQEDFAEMKAQLPRHYVLRDDFIRAIAALDSKVDNISKEIGEINKTLNRMTLTG